MESVGIESRYQILQFFSYKHLPEHLQALSSPFCELALQMASRNPDGNAETAAGLRKLLEAKDCFVRAGLSVGNQSK